MAENALKRSKKGVFGVFGLLFGGCTKKEQKVRNTTLLYYSDAFLSTFFRFERLKCVSQLYAEILYEEKKTSDLLSGDFLYLSFISIVFPSVSKIETTEENPGSIKAFSIRDI